MDICGNPRGLFPAETECACPNSVGYREPQIVDLILRTTLTLGHYLFKWRTTNCKLATKSAASDALNNLERRPIDARCVGFVIKPKPA